ncbi:MAG: ClpP family protease [Oscillospiraceae bacterium]
MKSRLYKLIESSRGIDRINIDDELLRERKIFLNEDINVDNCTEIIKALMLLDSQAPDEEITLYIDSPGGDCESGLALYDAIRMVHAKVRAVCVGLCASMAAVIYLAADQREILPHSRIMIHDPSFACANFSGQKSKEIEEHLAGLNKMRETLASIIAERTGKSIKQIYKVTQYDSFYTAEEAVEFGLAHKITYSLT